MRRLSGAVSLAALATTARSMGRSVRIVDGGADKKAALAAFAEGLALPDWFGKNLDALTDALRDLADETAREIELVWDGTALKVLRDVEAERDDLHITVIER